ARRWSWTTLAALACALGMGTKEVMISAPIIVVLWDMIFTSPPGSGTRPSLLPRSRWPLYVALAATWFVLALSVLSEQRTQSVGFGGGMLGAWPSLLTQPGVLVHYLRLAFVPSPLIFQLGWPIARSLAQVAAPATLIMMLVALTLVGL